MCIIYKSVDGFVNNVLFVVSLKVNVICKSVDDFVNIILLIVSLLNKFLITFNWNMMLKMTYGQSILEPSNQYRIIESSNHKNIKFFSLKSTIESSNHRIMKI